MAGIVVEEARRFVAVTSRDTVLPLPQGRPGMQKNRRAGHLELVALAPV